MTTRSIDNELICKLTSESLELEKWYVDLLYKNKDDLTQEIYDIIHCNGSKCHALYFNTNYKDERSYNTKKQFRLACEGINFQILEYILKNPSIYGVCDFNKGIESCKKYYNETDDDYKEMIKLFKRYGYKKN